MLSSVTRFGKAALSRFHARETLHPGLAAALESRRETSVRADAEHAALMVAAGMADLATNPYEANSREHGAWNEAHRATLIHLLDQERLQGGRSAMSEIEERLRWLDRGRRAS